MSVANNIKAIRDIMRKDEGVDGDAQRISQMVWMLFMKIFTDKEEEWKISLRNYQSPIPEEFKWQNWAINNNYTGDHLIDFINIKLFPTLKNLNTSTIEQARIVKSVFEDTFNYMKKGTLVRQVINEINKIDFNNSKDQHIFNEIYESILKELQSAGSSGEYYTPRAVTQFMVDIIKPQLGETILDPACGTGGFLTCTIENIRKQLATEEALPNMQKFIRGVEKKPLPHLLCTTNLILHGFDLPNINRGNMLSKPYGEWTSEDKVDIVLSNPPFGGSEEDDTEKNFPQKFQTKETSDLFLALIIKILKDDGRGGVVMPDSILFGEGVKTRIKQELLSKCNLHTIVRLPGGVFHPYTSIKTNLLFFDKGKPTKEIWYYELPYPNGIRSYNKSRTIHIEDFDNIKQWWFDRKSNQFAWKVGIDEIKSNNYNLDIKNPSDEKTTQALPSFQILEKLLNNLDQSRELVNQIQVKLKV